MKRAELHVHSTYSDGLDRAERIVDVAVRLGIDAISITDHDTVQGSMAALDYVRDEHLDIEVIPGAEISTSDGHLLVYYIERDIDKGMSLMETIEEVRKRNGICAVSHPFQIERSGAFRIELIKHADALEVFNAKYVIGIFNRISERIADRYGMAKIAGSDAHTADEVGYGLTLYTGTLKEAIAERKTEYNGRKMPLSRQIGYSLKKKFIH
ncbi:PHP domain-containing protein [Geoglobus acetivorans]|uniref:Polymerase/histidinol phosphatase N-terminal domain-containing protein n=1 Tax=Geoglobus acetivorans TaxID=565033 RepID=A0A0A7GB34_GEOAI|nr:hypothetical protein GACE_0162 [Geoglobus acetivorans]